MVLLNPVSEISDSMGFTYTLRASSSFPTSINHAALLQTFLLSAAFCYMMYFCFKLSFVNRTPIQIISSSITKTKNFQYQRASLLLSVLFVALSFSDGFLGAYFALPIKIASISMLLMALKSFSMMKKNTFTSPAFLLTLFFLTLPAIVSFSRGLILMPFISIFILVYFNLQLKIYNFKSTLLWASIGLVIIFFTTLTKLYFGAVDKEYESLNLYFQMSINDWEDTILPMFKTLLNRLNNSQSLYWYLYDMYQGHQVFVTDRLNSLFYIPSTLIPGVIGNSNEFRFVNGMPLEQWLFLEYTGLNKNGGFAIPPLVEFIWATRSSILGLFVTFFIFLFFSLFFNFIVKNTKFGGPCLIVLCFYIFLKNESVAILALYSIKVLPAATLVCYISFRFLRLFSFFMQSNSLNIKE